MEGHHIVLNVNFISMSKNESLLFIDFYIFPHYCLSKFIFFIFFNRVNFYLFTVYVHIDNNRYSV